jgi:hypothetical protein
MATLALPSKKRSKVVTVQDDILTSTQENGTSDVVVESDLNEVVIALPKVTVKDFEQLLLENNSFRDACKSTYDVENPIGLKRAQYETVALQTLDNQQLKDFQSQCKKRREKKNARQSKRNRDLRHNYKKFKKGSKVMVKATEPYFGIVIERTKQEIKLDQVFAEEYNDDWVARFDKKVNNEIVLTAKEARKVLRSCDNMPIIYMERDPSNI